ncbi:MAG TPA: tripartite tricarboxylate transporter TctB family protein [Thermodesulfobacteriota bacterium]|nr:tripartite tricarboxylate transporter TctB family protein [Thermodesulfobacteriota bacterium]
MKSLDFWSSIFWMLFSLGVIKLTTRLPLGTLHEPGSGFFPLLLSFIILGLSLGLFLRTLIKGRLQLAGIASQLFKSLIKIAPVLILLSLYAVFLDTLGFLVVTFLLIFSLLEIIYRQKWWVSLITAGAGSMGSYVIFQIWLQSQLPKGFLGF